MNKEHDKTTQTKTDKNKAALKDLRVYQLARTLEDKVGKLVEALPESEFYLLGNDLKRASSGCAHYISQFSERYSFSAKTDCLHEARRQAEDMVGFLIQYQDRKFGQTADMVEEYTAVIKQTWG